MTVAARLLEEGGDGDGAGVGLREVARAAGVSAAAPYRHFASREALLAAVAVRGFQALASALTAAGEAADIDQGDRLAALGRCYVRFALDHPGLFRLMFGGTLRHDDHPDLAAAGPPAFAPLQAAVTAEVAGADPRGAAIAAWALVHGLAHLLLDRRLADDLQAPAATEALVARVVGVFVRGLAAADGATPIAPLSPPA